MSNLIFNLVVTFEKRYSKETGEFIEKKMVVEFDTAPCTVVRKILPNQPITGNVTIEYFIASENNNQFFSHHKEEFDYNIDFDKSVYQTTTLVVVTENEDGESYSENAACTSNDEEDVIKPGGERKG